MKLGIVASALSFHSWKVGKLCRRQQNMKFATTKVKAPHCAKAHGTGLTITDNGNGTQLP